MQSYIFCGYDWGESCDFLRKGIKDAKKQRVGWALGIFGVYL